MNISNDPRRSPFVERRVLGLDVGGRRIGVAVSDAYGTLASPLTTINALPRAQALEKIVALARENEVGEVVLGLPLTMRGEVGPQAQIIHAFATELEAVLGYGVNFFDERLTTAAAEQLMRDLGMKPEKRKAQIDQVAASIILQDYLDHIRNRP